MGGSSTCLISLAVLTVWLAFACCITALFAPFWVSLSPDGDNPSKSTGIYMKCFDPYDSYDAVKRECEWLTEDDGDYDWWLAIGVMWPIATGLLLVCSIGACLMCCDKCRKVGCFSFLGAACFIAFGLIVASVVVWGIKYPEDELEIKSEDAIDLFDRDHKIARYGGNVYFDWGYYLAIGGGCLSLLGFIFFDLAVCCLRKDAYV